MARKKREIVIVTLYAELDLRRQGYVVVHCARCEARVLLSPYSQRLARRHIARILCLDCCRVEASQDPEGVRFMRLAPEQRLEIARATGLYGDALDELIRDGRRWLTGKVFFDEDQEGGET